MSHRHFQFSPSLALERAFLGVMVVASFVLAVLQYRWIDRLAHAELQGDQMLLESRAQAFTQTFDRELTSLCLGILPAGNKIVTDGIEAANLEAYKKWSASNSASIFSHVVVVHRGKEGFQFWEISAARNKLVPFVPPAAWDPLLKNLEERPTDGFPPPFEDPKGLLLEYPIFPQGSSPDSSPEVQWTVLELNREYVSKTWLPWLAGQFIDPASAAMDVVRSEGEPRLLFSAGTSREGNPLRLPFNFQGHPAEGRGEAKHPVWQLEIWPRTSELQHVVYWSKFQGFATALLLDVLILACAYTLVRYTRNAQQVAEAQFNFVSATSHELRTPLTVIRGAAHNIERGIVTTSEGLQHYSSLIRANAEKLTQMVEQILAFAATQKKRLSLSLENVDAGEIVEKSLLATKAELENTNIQVEWQRRDPGAFVQGDAAALQRAFQNLISNAVKHGEEGGWIGLAVEKRDEAGSVVITISDRGLGIPADERSRIFDPFFRGARAVSSQKRGSGIGLSLVREIIEAHRGVIEMQTGDTVGAQFRVILPLDFLS